MYISKKQSWHIEPPWGLMNDPNGLICYQGNYYAFFQWNRFKKDHSSKAWGWCVSPDLVHWRFRGSALLPDQPYDAQGVYSGSAIEINARLCLYYTGNAKKNGCWVSSQCLAVSEDGMHFEKYGPIISTPAGYTQHFRDPKVISGLEKDYCMVLGAQQDNGYGALLLYSSPDGLKWNSYRVIGTSREYQMIECPDLFILNEKTVLLYCPQHRDNAIDDCIDSFSVYKVLQNFSQNVESTDLDIGWSRLDEGFDFYAPQTFLTPDGRRILLAWMSRMEGEEEISFAAHEPRIHCLTMPREIFLCGNRLCQRPVRELRNLSGNYVLSESQENGECYYPETRAFRLTMESEPFCKDFGVVLHEGEWSFHYHASTRRAQVYRRRWTDDGEDVRSVFVRELKKIELWCDQSSAELFLNNGEYVFSARIDARAEHPSLRLSGVFNQALIQVIQLPENLYQYFPEE